MGKSWKEKPEKWRKNRDFQKKQKKHQKGGFKPQKEIDEEAPLSEDYFNN
jgi:hypothetical protein